MDYLVVENDIIMNIVECSSEEDAHLIGALPYYDGALIGEKYSPIATQEAKMARIEQSKADLALYLESNPMLWVDGNYYSITKEKQTQLTSKLAVAQAKATMGVPYDLKWNTTDEVCVPWEISNLYALAFAIDERVTALVSYQQEREVAIRNARTQDELNAIVVDYGTV